MPDNDTTREEELRSLLTDAIEVQLAALKAGIGFWTEWIEQTSAFVNSATKTLSSINTDDQETKDVLLELLDAGRESARSMTEIPRHTATRFLEELDRLDDKKKEAEAAAKKVARKASRKKIAKKAARKKVAKKAVRKTARRRVAKKTGARAKKAGAPAKKSAGRSRRRRAGRVKE
jgi:hypothetical protein